MIKNVLISFLTYDYISNICKCVKDVGAFFENSLSMFLLFKTHNFFSQGQK
jgi:hypothetical protein